MQDFVFGAVSTQILHLDHPVASQLLSQTLEEFSIQKHLHLQF